MRLFTLLVVALYLALSGCAGAPLTESPSKAYLEQLDQPADSTD